ncbi:MAG: hypothetical protein HY822_24470 [Acidobacteria bacterium]|nr:hypothetical protein [Acidobacteriota bacterium]
MEPHRSDPLRRKGLHLLSGIQAGVMGALAMLVWFAAASLWRQDPWWAFPNLMASGVYGDAVFRLGFGPASWAGMALLVLFAGCWGALIGIAAPESASPFRFLLIALAAGLAWYYATVTPGVNRWAPLVPLYLSKPVLCVGHLIYGLFLAAERRHFRRILAATAAATVPGNDAHEFSAGPPPSS